MRALPAAYPVRPIVEFVGNRSLITHPFQQWVPPLPQRGLQPRAPERRGRVRSLAFKGNPENVPDELKGSEWENALQAWGVEWLLDVPSRTDGQDQSWHDFSAVDAVLCVRRQDRTDELGSAKPPTRLVNAWVAGCVPLAAREPGYAEIGVNGADTLFVDSPRDALPLLDRLANDSDLVARLEAAIDVRGSEFAPARVLKAWRDALVTAAAEASRVGVLKRRRRSLGIRRHRVRFETADWLDRLSRLSAA